MSQSNHPSLSSCHWSEETIKNYQKRKAEGHDVPDEDYEASLPTWIPTESIATDLDLSSSSALPEMGVVPSVLQASDNSIQFPVLPLVCKSISQMSLRRPHSISLDAAQHIQQSTVGQASDARLLVLHACTITSSNFKKIISRQSTYTMELFN